MAPCKINLKPASFRLWRPLLYWLLYEKLFPFFHPFRIFRYLTFRTAFASLTALLIALFIGPWVIQKLREFQIGQFIREDGPQSHLKKTGTPTMGGVLIASPFCCPRCCGPTRPIPLSGSWSFPRWPSAPSALPTTTSRWSAAQPGPDGARQAALAGAGRRAGGRCAGGAGAVQACSPRGLTVPFIKSLAARPAVALVAGTLPHLACWPLCPSSLWVMLVLVGTSNAVNLTDGLDGLAIGCTIIAAGALAVLTYVSGHVVFADYLELQRMPMVGELTVFCGSMVGASIGFLWYNAHPAEIFMGDVGSLALGGAIGTVAIIIRQELLLPFIGGIFILEAVSVILQVGSYKLRKKRIFKMAPLHHHFEQLGWSESKVIVRFWIGALVFALFALTTLKLALDRARAHAARCTIESCRGGAGTNDGMELKGKKVLVVGLGKSGLAAALFLRRAARR
jgi:phospho-N-acetylmuramoyl-pentapeptide-transferase